MRSKLASWHQDAVLQSKADRHFRACSSDEAGWKELGVSWINLLRRKSQFRTFFLFIFIFV